MFVLVAGLLGLLWGVGVSLSAWDGSVLDDGVAVLFLAGPATLAIGWVGGLLVPRSLGSLANGLLLGSLPAGLLAMIAGHWAAAPPLLLLTACLWVVTYGNARRAGRAAVVNAPRTMVRLDAGASPCPGTFAGRRRGFDLPLPCRLSNALLRARASWLPSRGPFPLGKCSDGHHSGRHASPHGLRGDRRAPRAHSPADRTARRALTTTGRRHSCWRGRHRGLARAASRASRRPTALESPAGHG